MVKEVLPEVPYVQIWRPLTFTAREVALIAREEPPDDVFRVERTIPLGTGRPPAPPGGR